MLALFNIGGGEMVLLLISLLIIPIGLSFVFWIWMLVDCIKNESLSESAKIAWVLVIVLTHLLGAIIYFFAGRERRRMQA